jgi:hypothetical protein
VGDNEFLSTIAEVSVTLAGFAGLVTVVAERLGERSRARGAHMLSTMLLYCLTAAGFALVPQLFLRAGVDDASSWRICSAAFFVVWGAFFLRAFPAANRFVQDTTLGQRLVAYLGIAISSVGLVTLLLNALGVFGSLSAVAYQGSLLVLLLAAARLFVLLFMSLARSAA